MGERQGANKKAKLWETWDTLVRSNAAKSVPPRAIQSAIRLAPLGDNPITNRKRAALLLVSKMQAHLGDQILDHGKGELVIDGTRHHLLARSIFELVPVV